LLGKWIPEHIKIFYNVLPDGKRLLVKGFILQQDNDPKHKERRVMRYLNSKQNYGNFLFVIASFIFPHNFIHL
jgi:hypothetical protein